MAAASLTDTYQRAAAAVVVSFLLIGLLLVAKTCGKYCSTQARGVSLVLLVAFIWTSSSVCVQLVFEEAHFRKPFFLTWYGVALLVVYLPFYPRRVRKLCAALTDEFSSRPRRSVSFGKASYTIMRADRESRASSDAELNGTTTDPPSPIASLSIALRLGLIYFSYQLFFNIGLELTAVSTVTVISASSGLWTLLFSALRLRERISPIKLFSTLLTFSGVLLVVLASGSGERDHPIHLHGHNDHGRSVGAASSSDAFGRSTGTMGNGMALISALLYGLYAAQLKHEVPTEESLPMPCECVRVTTTRRTAQHCARNTPSPDLCMCVPLSLHPHRFIRPDRPRRDHPTPTVHTNPPRTTHRALHSTKPHDTPRADFERPDWIGVVQHATRARNAARLAARRHRWALALHTARHRHRYGQRPLRAIL